MANEFNNEVVNITNENKEQDTKSSTGFINGHEYVDLGLSVKWATHNIGAEYPSDYGDYIAWGEMQPKSEYVVRNSVTYCKRFKNIEGNPAYDAARANWGGTWRLPTKDEIEELTLCKRRWITERGHEGYEIIGPNGNSIFLPAGGWHHKTKLRKAGEEASYWSATPRKFFLFSFTLYFGRDFFRRDFNLRYDGGLIRPVSK